MEQKKGGRDGSENLYRSRRDTVERVGCPARFTPLRSPIDRRSPDNSHPANDRRHSSERRVTVAPPEWVHGWICFQSDGTKLRLCPLPERWEEAEPEDLESFRKRAVPVRSSR